MNQILSVETQQKKEQRKPNNFRNNSSGSTGGKQVKITSILRIFAIALIIFGICMISSGAYAFIKKDTGPANTISLQPSISIENKDENTKVVKVMSNKDISKLEYYWNNDTQNTVSKDGNGKYAEEEITIPAGTNTLHIIITDTDGEQSTHDETINRESNIQISSDGNKVKIICDSKKVISYMTYRWDENDEQRVDINDTRVDQEIEAMKGKHTLTVVMVDEDNNMDTKTQKINALTKPTVTLGFSDDQKRIVVNASDEEKLKSIEFRIDQDENQHYEKDLSDQNLKEIKYEIPFDLKPGKNYIEVTVKNEDDLTAETGLVEIDN